MSANILDPNPFTTPIIAKTGDRDAEKTYAAVGVALTQWEICEMSFGALYSAFVKPTGNNHLVLRAYGTILAAGTRRDMIDAAAEAFFACFPNGELEGRLSKLLKLHRDAAARRNEVAHGIVAAIGTPPQVFVIPSFFSSKKRKIDMMTVNYRLSSAELGNYARCFTELASRAGKFIQDVRAAYEALPERLRAQFA